MMRVHKDKNTKSAITKINLKAGGTTGLRKGKLKAGPSFK